MITQPLGLVHLYRRAYPVDHKSIIPMLRAFDRHSRSKKIQVQIEAVQDPKVA